MRANRCGVPEESPIPVMGPRLPAADRLLPYLRRIDAARVYTNHGPLVLELESRLAAELALPDEAVVSASSGSAALVGALLASAGQASARRPLAMMPAYTFVATALAAEQCGYRPYLVDVDPRDWMLHPEQLLRHPQLDQVGVVVPVAPFGIGVPQEPWLDFRDRTGIPVVIDGAACFEAASDAPSRYLGDIPVAMSFHATKGFATGEGGCAVCADLELAGRIATALNFGFFDSRDCLAPSINGKLSEYHAAIGLAELDGWSWKKSDFATAAERYRRLAEHAGFASRLLAAPRVCSSYVLFSCDDSRQSARVQDCLKNRLVEFRLWYGTGLHRHPHLRASARDPLPVTERIAPCLLGLPSAPDLDESAIRRVVDALAEGMERCPDPGVEPG